MILTKVKPYTLSEAVLSDCGIYRYSLTRRWDDEPSTAPLVTWVLLNPSTADHEADDPTIRRVRGFTERMGYGGFKVVNLFALRSTSPKALRTHPDPFGPFNLDTLENVALRPQGPTVFAWGAHGHGTTERHLALICWKGRKAPLCLGDPTKTGQPRHPLYAPANIEIKDYQL